MKLILRSLRLFLIIMYRILKERKITNPPLPFIFKQSRSPRTVESNVAFYFFLGGGMKLVFTALVRNVVFSWVAAFEKKGPVSNTDWIVGSAVPVHNME